MRVRANIVDFANWIRPQDPPTYQSPLDLYRVEVPQDGTVTNRFVYQSLDCTYRLTISVSYPILSSTVTALSK